MILDYSITDITLDIYNYYENGWLKFLYAAF